MSKLFLLEGIPGSGKSTLAQILFEGLNKNSNSAKLWDEHKVDNPLDITRKAFLTEEEYEEVLANLRKLCGVQSKYSSEDVEQKIREQSKPFRNGYLISYLSVYFSEVPLMAAMNQLASREFCNGLVPAPEYEQVLLDLFSEFAEQDHSYDYAIVCGAILQNPLLDFIRFYDYSLPQLLSFYRKLSSILQKFDFTIYLLHSEQTEKTLRRAADHRKPSQWDLSFYSWLTGETSEIPADVFASLAGFCNDLQMTAEKIAEEVFSGRVCYFNSENIINKRWG